MYLRIEQVSYVVMSAMLAMMLVFLSLERYQCSSACVSYSEKDPTADLCLTCLWIIEPGEMCYSPTLNVGRY